MSGTKTMYAFQEWAQNFSRQAAPRSGRAAAQGNETARVLHIYASEKRHRGDPQRIGARPWDETHEISGAESSRLVALLHGRGLQCETVSKSARLPDQSRCSEPRLGVQGS